KDKYRAVLLLSFVHGGGSLVVGHARRIVVAKELHIAAERNRGDFPAGAVAVVEADYFGAKPDRERQHLDAAQAGHQEMAKLMKEHDYCQHKEEWDDIADEAAAESAQAPHNIHTHHNPSSRPYGAFIVSASLLE